MESFENKKDAYLNLKNWKDKLTSWNNSDYVGKKSCPLVTRCKYITSLHWALDLSYFLSISVPQTRIFRYHHSIFIQEDRYNRGYREWTKAIYIISEEFIFIWLLRGLNWIDLFSLLCKLRLLILLRDVYLNLQ